MSGGLDVGQTVEQHLIV